LVWTIIPTILGLAVFAWSTSLYVRTRQMPKDGMDVYVVGKQWMWQIQHSNGVRENNELHVPVGRPVRLTMISQDVIHSLLLPEFRVQKHVEPGQYTTLWFTATKPGQYKMFCAMHCGTQHSEMGGYVYAMESADFEKWLNSGGSRTQPTANTIEEAGRKLFNDYSCSNCHNSTSNLRAPILNNLFGKPRIMEDGRTLVADENYIRQSILYPAKNIVKGYDIMPAYGQFTEQELLQLTAYIKSLTISQPLVVDSESGKGKKAQKSSILQTNSSILKQNTVKD
jgi:cytochrome c oxidase subunit 2